jgi:hypothetical protein
VVQRSVASIGAVNCHGGLTMIATKLNLLITIERGCVDEDPNRVAVRFSHESWKKPE